MFNRHREKQKQLVMTNLTYMRLLSDAAALDAALERNRPLEHGKTDNFFSWLFEAVRTEAANVRRQMVSEDLGVKKAKAEEALAEFERTTPEKQLALARSPEKLRAYINKKLFKNDESGAERIRFALAFMAAPGCQYQLPEESLAPISQLLFDDGTRMGELYGMLQDNYIAVCKNSLADDLAVCREIKQVFAFFSVMPSYVLELVTPGIKLRTGTRETLTSLSLDEERTYLAMQLTLVEALKPSLGGEETALLVDAVLKRIADLRADAEYEWIVERHDERSSRERIDSYDRALERLNAILKG